MDDLLDITLLVLGIFATMSGLLYVLTAIDPQTERSPQVPDVPAPQPQLSRAA